MLSETIIIALTLFFEASIGDRAERRAIMRAIARTIQVRSEERKISMKEACLQPSQYSCWNGKNKLKILEMYHEQKIQSTPAWKEALRVANEAKTGDLNCMVRWNHYYNPKLCEPSWAWKMKETKVIKHHIFGRIES